MHARNHYVKIIMIVVAVVCFITAALLLLQAWEGQRGRFPQLDTEDGIVRHDGKEYVRKDGIETFLVLGLDKYKDATASESHASGSIQADFLMLFVFDNTAQECTAIQINRDTMTKINRLGIDGSKIETVTKQIALAYNHAYDESGKKNCRNTAEAVEELLFGMKVDHYMSLTMDSVVELNDLVGGVEVTVQDDFTGIDDTLIQGQTVTLKGEQALRYVRTRYGLEDSTNSTRMERQQQYMNALYDKVLSCVETDEEFVLKAVNQLQPYIVYDSSEFRMQEFAKKFDGYAFLGIRKLEGEIKVGEEFAEFYPDEQVLWDMVINLFYTEKVI